MTYRRDGASEVLTAFRQVVRQVFPRARANNASHPA
jgi:hypothetical protein